MTTTGTSRMKHEGATQLCLLVFLLRAPLSTDAPFLLLNHPIARLVLTHIRFEHAPFVICTRVSNLLRTAVLSTGQSELRIFLCILSCISTTDIVTLQGRELLQQLNYYKSRCFKCQMADTLKVREQIRRSSTPSIGRKLLQPLRQHKKIRVS